METRTRILLSVVSSIAVSVAIGFAAFSILKGMNGELRQGQVYDEIIEKTHALNILTASFSKGSDQSDASQIKGILLSLDGILKGIASQTRGEEVLVRQLQRNDQELGPLIDQMLFSGPEIAGGLERERRSMLSSQVWMKVRFISDDTNRLKKMSQARMIAAQEKAGAMVIALIIILTLTNGGIYYFSSRSIMLAQEALREREEEFRAFFHNAAVGAAELGLDGRIIEVNGRMCQITGFSRDELLRMTPAELTHPEDREQEDLRLAAYLHGESPVYQAEKRYICKDGRVIWVQVAAAIVRDASGQPIRSAAIIEEITERKEAEEKLRETAAELMAANTELEGSRRAAVNLLEDAQAAQKLAEESTARLRESDALLRTATDNAAVGLVMLDRQRRYTFANPAYARILELPWTADELIGKGPAEVLSTVYPAEIAPRLDRAFAGERVTYDLTKPRAGSAHGETAHYVVVYDPVRGSASAVDGVIVTIFDITARKQAEEALRESERRFRQVVESLPQLVWTCDPEGPCDYLSPQWVDYTGLPEEKQLGFVWLEQLHPEDRQRTIDHWQATAGRGADFAIDFRIRRHDGAYRWFHTLAVPLRDEAGRIVKWFGTNTDIDDLKQVEEVLNNISREQSIILDNMPIGISKIVDRKQVWINRRTEEMFQYTSEEMLYQTTRMFYPSDDAYEKLGREAYPVLAQGGVFETEQELIRKDGSAILVRYIGSAIDPADTAKGVLWLLEDITQRRRSEAALLESEEKLSLALRAAEMGVWQLDLREEKRYFDDQVCRCLGIDPARFSGTAEEFFAAVHPDDRSIIIASLDRTIESGEPYEAEYRAVWPDGRVRYIAARGRLERDASGKPRAVDGLVWDITERKLAEERLQASLHEKEVLLKEIHHRVKNNLQVISSLVGLQADGTGDETVREVLREVTFRVRSMSMVHEKLYQSHSLASIEFADYSKGLLNYLWRSYGKGADAVRLTLRLEPVHLPVDIAVPCGLILNELAGNALKHAFRGREKGEVTVTLHERTEGVVSLSLHDDGVGLPAGFDWRKTRSLGLRLVHMLAGQLKAQVEVSGGEGTGFEISFSQQEVKA